MFAQQQQRVLRAAALALLCAGPPALAAEKLPRVHVVGTGGTIASKGRDPLQLSGYSIALTARELIEAVPGLERIASLSAEQFSNVPSYAITPESWLRLARRINEIFDKDSDLAGIVVLHGTDTLEETAYFLHLTVRSDRPVVVVGAMRPASAISADGPLNLFGAVRTAAASEARGKGVLVLLNDQISSAREATKQSTYRADAFRAGEAGYLGSVDADRVVFYRASLRRHTRSSEFRIETLTSLPRVDVVYSYAGSDGVAIDALARAGARGIVVAGTGAGHMTPAETDALLRAREGGVPVVIGSRVGSGRVFDAVSVDGKGSRLGYREHGIVSSDNLTPQKARILLMLGLTMTQSPQELQRIFDQY